MKAISLDRRTRIYALIKEGYSSREIAYREKISHSTVLRINVIPKTGRPRISTKRHDRNVNAVQVQKN